MTLKKRTHPAPCSGRPLFRCLELIVMEVPGAAFDRFSVRNRPLLRNILCIVSDQAMPRQKNVPMVVSRKMMLADRLRARRVELYGERGGPRLARQLNLPARTWYNYEKGVTIPGEVLLDFLQLTETSLDQILHESVSRQKSSKALHHHNLYQSNTDLMKIAQADSRTNQKPVSPAVGQMFVQAIDASMEPAISPGTLVGVGNAISPMDYIMAEGQIVVAWIALGPMIRRLVSASNYWWLQADCSGWPAIAIDTENTGQMPITLATWFQKPIRG